MFHSRSNMLQKKQNIIIGHACSLDLHDYRTNERRSKIDCTRSYYENVTLTKWQEQSIELQQMGDRRLY